MSSKIVLGLAIILVLALLSSVLLHERWTTPTREARFVLSYYALVKEQEETYFKLHSRYGGVFELLRDCRGSGHCVLAECESGYCLDLSANRDAFNVLIKPDMKDRSQPPRLMSLFSDQTGVVHISYGRPHANYNSPVLSHREVARLLR
jgi:hypothetical protein